MASLGLQALHPSKIQEIVTQPRAESIDNRIDRRVPQPVKVDYSVTHALPGKVGFCVPQLTEDPKYLHRLQQLLIEDHCVSDEQFNRNTGSIVINYKPGVMTDAEMRSHLANLIQSAGDAVALESLAVSTRTVTPKQSSQPQPTTKLARNKPSAKQSAKIAYSIAHAIPGRVRFRVPRIAQDPEYVKRLKALLKADERVTSERVNSAAASVVITYKSGTTRNAEIRKRSLLECISYLAKLIQSASDAVVATNTAIVSTI